MIRADAAVMQMGSPEVIRGAEVVAGAFSGRAAAAQPALVGAGVGVVWAPGGRAKVVWDLTIADGKIVHVDMIATAYRLGDLEHTILSD